MTTIDANLTSDGVAQYLERREAMATPDSLMAWLDPTWRRPKHVRYMGDILSGVQEGNRRIILQCSVRHGKALAPHTPIPTPAGWTTMGDVAVGDLVYDHAGQTQPVVAKHGPFRARTMRVRFNDGTHIDAHPEHEWMTFTEREIGLYRYSGGFRKPPNDQFAPDWWRWKSDRSGIGPQIRTTQQLAETLEARPGSKQAHNNHTIPNALAIKGGGDLPIDPYILGLWLGDGTSARAEITVGHEDKQHVIDEVVRAGYPEPPPRSSDMLVSILGMHAQLRAADLLGNKHIPAAYLRASEQDREALLMGLMDSDGSITGGAKDRRVEFANTNERLARQAAELARSLGERPSVYVGKAVLNGRVVSDLYRVCWSASRQVFRLPRKAGRLRLHGSRTSGSRCRKVVGVDLLENEDHYCITVDGDSHLFLAGEGMVPTHNSWTASHALPVWYLEKNPKHLIGMASYQANFSALWGRRVRNTIKEHGHKEEKLTVRVSDDSSAAYSWETTEKGGMHTAGVGGEFTGRGFQLMIVDDPIKNWEQANSEVQRENDWEWYTSTFRSRLEPNGSIVVIMARWHEDDMTGRLLEAMKGEGEDWTVIDLPALAVKNDALGRKPGEPLWPERFTRENLETVRGAVGKRVWQALYQQNPRPEDGNRYKREWFRYAKRGDGCYKLPQDDGSTKTVYDQDLTKLSVADLAQTAKTEADYTVRGIVAITKQHDIILLDIWRAQADSPTVKRVLAGDYNRFNLDKGCFEDAHWGKTLNQEFLADGLAVMPLKPGTQDKVARSSVSEDRMEAGKFYFLEDIPHLDDLENELLAFPNGAHDDCVDMVSWAAIVTSKLKRPGIVFTNFTDAKYQDGGNIVPNLSALPNGCKASLLVQPGATTGVLLCTVDPEDTLVVMDEIYEPSDDAEALAARLTGLLARNKVDRRSGVRAYLMDPDAVFMRQKEVGVTAGELGGRGWGFGPWVQSDQDAGDSQIQVAFRSRSLVICDRCKHLREELRQYSRKMDRDGLPVDGTYLGQDYLIRPLRAFVGSKPTYGGRF